MSFVVRVFADARIHYPDVGVKDNHRNTCHSFSATLSNGAT
jgi:hypothetical protein